MTRRRPAVAPLVFTLVSALVLLGGIAILRTLDDALVDAGVAADAAGDIRRAVLVALLAIGFVAAGIAIVGGRALAHTLRDTRTAVLARARGDDAPLPAFALAELTGIAHAVERLHARLVAREADLSREAAELNVLLDSISEGILRIDPDGHVLRANAAGRSLLGLTTSVAGEPVTAYVRDTELRRILERAAHGERIDAAEIALGEWRLLVSARPVHEGGGAVVAFVDLTQLRRLESVRRDFVANVSHELKTPLTSIRGYVETLLADDDTPPDVRRQFLEVVQRNAHRLHHIVDDLLDLSRLESGGWRPDLHDVDIAGVVEDVWSSCAQRAADRDVSFTPPRGRVIVRADPGGLRQVLSNLLDNALRYTPAGGRIEVVAGNGTDVGEPPESATAPFVTIEVRDTGTGIPADALPRIFERFYRVDPARSRAEGGTGLGLSIVKHLVESMGGTVAAESRLGRGTTVRVRLPAG